MEDQLYPIIGPGIVSPRGVHTLWVIAGMLIFIGVGYLYISKITKSDNEDIQPVEIPFDLDAWIVLIDELIDSAGATTTGSYISELYALLLQAMIVKNTDFSSVPSSTLPSSTLHEIMNAQSMSDQEKNLLATLYTPVFVDGEWDYDKKVETAQNVKNIVIDRHRNSNILPQTTNQTIKGISEE